MRRRIRLAAIAALARRPEVARLRRFARRRRVASWIVGGAVRDAALGIAPAEIDIAVSHLAEELAGDCERAGGGRAVFLSRDRPGPRVFRVAGKRPLDLAEVEGASIEEDLGRRDFTANAIALSLDDGRLVDPFGGLADLDRRRLSCVAPRNIAEDPLRALRAARFLATHGLKPDRAVLAASRAAGAGLRDVAAERISGELSKLLASPEAAPALGWAARAGILPIALGRPLTIPRSFALARSVRELDGATARRLSPGARRRLRLAYLAWRLGLSDRQTRQWLKDRRWPRREAEEAARLVGLARDVSAVQTRTDAWRWILAAGDLAGDASRLAGHLGAAERRRAPLLARLARRRPGRVAVTGADVMHWLDLPPGPAVGALLAQLAIAAASGAVKNRSQARHWLIGQVRKDLSPAIISTP